jgi:LmbE family N-acetylglucosaminyl deacetylase
LGLLSQITAPSKPETRKDLKKHSAVVFGFVFLLHLIAPAQPLEMRNAAELEITLHKLNVLGSVLFIAAHPDDENSSVLAYFSKGRKYRTAYLSITRGDGGQNLIGPEKGAEIGIIRTQELMSARRIDGAEQFFTRAIDFGYSKTPEETFAFWGKDKILADVVWVIRKFRPDVIITRFPPDRSSGHGHHTASGILAKEAFQAASDPNRFPEQLKYVQPWQAERFYWNSWRPGQQEIKKMLRLDTGEYNPLLGKSYSEMAAASRSQHKSQGFGSAGRRGTQDNYFEYIAGIPATSDLFDGIDTSWRRVPGGQKVGLLLDEILASFDPQNPSKSIAQLIEVYAELTKLDETYWVSLKKEELLSVIRSCAGLWMEAIADDFAAAPGDEMRIKTTLVNRSDHPFTVHKISFPEVAPDSILDSPLKNNDPQTFENTIRIPKDFPISQPYWLKETPLPGMFSVQDQNLIGLAENPPSLRAKISLSSNGNLLEYSVPLLFRWTDRVEGELYRPFEIRPPVTLQLEEKVNLFTADEPKEIQVKLKSHSQNIAGEIRLKGAEKWQITPASIPFSLSGKYEEKEATFEVTPPKYSDEAVLIAEAEIGGVKIDRALVEISYPHIKRQVYFPRSRMKVVRLDVSRLGSKLGYIMGAGDEVADGLRTLGYEVIQLNDDMLENMDLSQFDAVIAGIRAYNTRERLSHTQERFLQYVENGGTFIVQYNLASSLQTKSIGPYPFTIGQDRVCLEDAPVLFLDPEHPLLNFPNKITPKDFEGWVQERGLYFASQWDEKYEPILASHDLSEPDKKGGMLYARYGRGVFIYTGYAWFRQLPEGVPGAFRIFANMISAGKFHGTSTLRKHG